MKKETLEVLVDKLQRRCAFMDKHRPGIWRELDVILSKRAGVVEAARKYRRANAELIAVGGTEEQAKIAQDRMLDPDPWPSWCFVPVANMREDRLHKEVLEQTSPLAMMMSLGAWRMTKGVYYVDDTVLDELWHTPMNGKIPAEVLQRLPEWTTVINLPHGAFKDSGEYKPDCLALCQMTKVGEMNALMITVVDDDGGGTITVPLKGTLDESVKYLIDTLDSSAARQRSKEIFGDRSPSDFAYRMLSKCRADMAGIISTLLYLCSEEPDVEGRARKAQPTKTKHGVRHFPPGSTNYINVGMRLGAILRRGREQGERYPNPGTHASPRPHIRGAHWHMYWTGPKSQPQMPRVKWLPPIPVNTRFAEVETVVRPVEEKV